MKNFNKNAVLVFVISLLISTLCLGQGNDLQQDMKKGFDTFDKGKEFADWLKGAEIMGSLGGKHKSEWLPNYWASYFYTQVARSIPKKNPPQNITAKDLLDLAQKNYYAAFNKVKNKSSYLRSDFHALQSLIYDFRGWMSKDKLEQKEFSEKAKNERKFAVNTDPNNPPG